jgi:hypothetical protein
LGWHDFSEVIWNPFCQFFINRLNMKLTWVIFIKNSYDTYFKEDRISPLLIKRLNRRCWRVAYLYSHHRLERSHSFFPLKNHCHSSTKAQTISNILKLLNQVSVLRLGLDSVLLSFVSLLTSSKLKLFSTEIKKYLNRFQARNFLFDQKAP